MLPNVDRSFSADAKAAFRDGIAALEREASDMTAAQFEMAVSRLVALAGNGHTTVDKRQRASDFGRVSVRLAWFTEGLFVVQASPSAQSLAGRRVVSIDGRTVDQALADLRPYLSGTPERARDDSPPLLECPALLRAIWADTDGEHLALTFEGGETVQLSALPAMPAPFALQPVLAIAGQAGGDWKTILAQAPETPLSLRAPQWMAFSAPLGGDGIYIRINGNSDDDRGPLVDQLAKFTSTRPAQGWRWIVLDLRFNDGGDETKTLGFTRTLPGLLKGDGGLWILTGNATFSAAIITAARAKRFVGARAHIVGARMGDHNPFWTTGGPPLVLRNSAIAIGHAYFKQDWVNGCGNIEVCYPGQFLYGVAAGDLSPEIAVGWSFSDYTAGRDTVLERVRTLAVGPAIAK